MKLFGFEFGRKKLDEPVVVHEDSAGIRDITPAVIRPELHKVDIPDNKKPGKIPAVKSSVLTYAGIDQQRGRFNESEYDLDVIGRIEDTEAYFAQANSKKSGLMFKEGYEFVGPNPRTIQYIKLRFKQMAQATGIPTKELLKAVGSSLVRKSNAFLVKARKTEASGGLPRMALGKNKPLEPVAGYFVAAAETMKPDLDEYGQVRRWKQELPDGNHKFHKPENVIHFAINKKDGLKFGTPTVIPVIEDIKALRKIEENIELLVYQHLFPLFHYKIGSDDMPAGINEKGEDEVDVARYQVRMMPSEGGLVTSHRHEIKLIGAENQSLRAEGYLEHFKKRVLSGLGVSAVDMGEGECYDEHTQTLTRSGWKFHWQIDHENEEIATYNLETRRIEFHVPNHKYEGFYKGPMIHFTGKHIDQMVTPAHDMYAWHNEHHIWGKYTAQEIIDGKAGTNSMFIADRPFADGEIPDTDRTISQATLAGTICAVGRVEGKDIILRKTRRFDSEELITQLQELEVPYEVIGQKDALLSVPAVSFDGFLSRLLTVTSSNPRALLNVLSRWSLQTRRAFLRSYIYNSDVKTDHASYIFNFTKTEDRDLFHEIILSAGWNLLTSRKLDPEGKEYWRCSVNPTAIPREGRLINIHKNVEVVDYAGIIYCYNVPNHLFVTRRNGKVAIQGNTANRSTSDNMSTNLVDSVKDIQRHFEAQFNDFVIHELLLESRLGVDALAEENLVYLKFKEIDLDHQIKKEAHYADQFNKDIITLHEARAGIGRQPFSIPTPDESENDPEISSKYPEWYATRWKLIGEPTVLIQSIDEPYSPAAKAAAAARSTEITESGNEEAGRQQEEREKRLTAAKPTASASKDSFLSTKFNDLESDLIVMTQGSRWDMLWFRQLAATTETLMKNELRSRVMASFVKGYKAVNNNSDTLIAANIRTRSKLSSRVDFYVHRLMNQLVSTVDRQGIDDLQKDDRIQKVKSVFSSLRYRNEFIEDVEIRKAYYLGQIEGARDRGIKAYRLVVDANSCEKCKMAAQEVYPIGDFTSLDDVPPLHPNSRTTLEFIRNDIDG